MVDKLNKTEICKKAIKALKIVYPKVQCTLNYSYPYQLLIAARLAAQCTDKRVNIITKDLFTKYSSLESFASANYEELKDIIKPCGFYKIKAKDIICMCKMLKEKYKSSVPQDIDELTKLPGVGRKTANLILGDIYKKPSIVVDTHCSRITRRLGLHSSKSPIIIEKILKEIVPPNESTYFCHRLVEHGRLICKSLKPKCNVCCMDTFCTKNLIYEPESRKKAVLKADRFINNTLRTSR